MVIGMQTKIKNLTTASTHTHKPSSRRTSSQSLVAAPGIPPHCSAPQPSAYTYQNWCPGGCSQKNETSPRLIVTPGDASGSPGQEKSNAWTADLQGKPPHVWEVRQRQGPEYHCMNERLPQGQWRQESPSNWGSSLEPCHACRCDWVDMTEYNQQWPRLINGMPAAPRQANPQRS